MVDSACRRHSVERAPPYAAVASDAAPSPPPPTSRHTMEWLLRLFGTVQTLLRLLMAPLRLLRTRRRQKPFLPPLENPLLALSASQLAARIRSGQVRSEQVVEAFVERIRAVDAHVNAVVEERFAAALEEARAVDAALAAGGAAARSLLDAKPLLGVPFTVKESCGLQGMSFCVGTDRRRGVKAREDGEAVALLRAAGAIPLCVTTTPELCVSWETNNLVTGVTLNPFDRRRTPGGSSGGEAALIGAGASVLGVGSDIAGSIRIPAHYVGIFGHKPTPGYVPLGGNYPLSEDPAFQKYLVLGPLCRYAEDLRPALKIMAGPSASALRLDEKVELERLRVLFLEDAGRSLALVPVEREIRQRVRRAAQFLHTQFNVPVQRAKIDEIKDGLEISGALFFEMTGIPDLLEDPVDPKIHHNLWLEILKCIAGLSKISLQAMGFTFLYKMKLFIPPERVPLYRKKYEALEARFKELLGDDGVFLFPTYPTAANFHNEVIVKTSGVLYTMLFNLLGMPATHVPLGLNKEGLPIGIQVVAAPHQDRLCLAVAETLEKGFGGWEPPPAAI